MVGMLHFWNMTIDTLSCINIVLAIGLCVDYSAHIAHAYIVSEGKFVPQFTLLMWGQTKKKRESKKMCKSRNTYLVVLKGRKIR